MQNNSSPTKGLGAIALQVRDLEAMTAFYRDIVNLPDLRRFETSVDWMGYDPVLAG